MAWLNFNDSLNNLKGQLSNFANNVFADEEGTELSGLEYKELKELCQQQGMEIKQLKGIIEEIKLKRDPDNANEQLTTQKHLQDGSNGSWDWDESDESNSKSSDNPISALKKNITILENEKAELLLQLEQLDADNQENLLNIMRMKEKLQFELNDLNEKYLSVKQENIILLAKEEKLINELQKLKEHEGVVNKEVSDDKHKEENINEKEIENLTVANQNLIHELEELKKELYVNKSSNNTFQKVLEETKKAAADEVKTMEKENVVLYTELKKTNEQIEFFEKKSIEDEENCQKLAIILETYEQQVSSLKQELTELSTKQNQVLKKQTETDLLYQNLLKQNEILKEEHKKEIQELEEEIKNLKDKENEVDILNKEIESLKKLNEDLLIKANGRMDMELNDELEIIQEEHESQLNIIRAELEQLKNEESKNATDRQLIDELEEEKLELTRKFTDLQQQYEFLQENHKLSLQQLHNKYINIITENIKKFQECEKPSDFEHCTNHEDNYVSEISKHVENIIKILLDLKYKCGDLEKQIIDLTDEKNHILLEKNHEIEKLIQNSDMLSQEIVTKNQTIKDYENECNELAKNNELLINELETYKNNPGLQTISESNEDNMILLESQLEHANKRVKTLERIIDDLEQRNKINIQEEDEEDENTEQIITENEINNKKKDYDDLLNNFDQLQIDYESTKKELQHTKEKNTNLQLNLDKLRVDNENLEYQINELNINYESLKDEKDYLKNELKELIDENSNLKRKDEEVCNKLIEFESKVEILSQKLVTEKMNKGDLINQIGIQTEKLKAYKMAETSLKLQYEQKSKELANQAEIRQNLEVSLNKINGDLAEYQKNFTELQTQHDKLLSEYEELKKISENKDKKLQELDNLVINLKNQISNSNPIEPGNKDSNSLKLLLEETVLEKSKLQTELDNALKESTDKETLLQEKLQELTNSRDELIKMVTMKHQENVVYHNEIQRLNQVVENEVKKSRMFEAEINQLKSNEDIEVKNKEIEKLTDQNTFLREKCEVIAKNLLEEQSKSQQLLLERSEKELILNKKLDRLQAHLIELEEHYTEELYQAEQKNNALKAKVNEIEDREKSSSTLYTSVSIRANQQVESLQSQLQTVIQERDLLRKQISDAEDENTKQAAALANLQFVLEQFRKDKEKDVIKETDRIRRHINAEKQIQEELKVEISNLKSQLEERNQGLLAASRLSDQLESCKKANLGLKEEVSQLETKYAKIQEELQNALKHTDGKVDKLLIKNLILGFVTSNNVLNRDQTQILKIIATVLDFNQQDHDKVKLNKPQQGWLASLLTPQSDSQNKITEESLSKAFIKFLENESKPRIVPSLLNNSVPSASSTKSTSTSSRSTTPNQAPIVLSEIVLPTFSDFAQNRNSSSILKDVLKDNS